MEKVANLNVGGLARRDRESSLNDGQIPNPNVVRVAPGARYHRVEGDRRASRNGRVSYSPTRNPRRHDIRDFCIAVGHTCACAAVCCEASSEPCVSSRRRLSLARSSSIAFPRAEHAATSRPIAYARGVVQGLSGT
jgi:hypothetical protein